LDNTRRSSIGVSVLAEFGAELLERNMRKPAGFVRSDFFILLMSLSVPPACNSLMIRDASRQCRSSAALKSLCSLIVANRLFGPTCLENSNQASGRSWRPFARIDAKPSFVDVLVSLNGDFVGYSDNLIKEIFSLQLTRAHVLRHNLWLRNKLWFRRINFRKMADIVDHCCDAWNKLASQPWRVMSIGVREWAHRF
jgi:hypothetical protein